jgi:hypothetical protein
LRGGHCKGRRQKKRAVLTFLPCFPVLGIVWTPPKPPGGLVLEDSVWGEEVVREGGSFFGTHYKECVLRAVEGVYMSGPKR